MRRRMFVLSAGLAAMAAPGAGSAACLASVVSAPDEATLVGLLNTYRAKVGLFKLQPTAGLTDSARSHSAQMAISGKLQHQVRGGRLTWAPPGAAAGENLAVAPGAPQAMELLVKSPEHRTNMLTPRWRRVGIGAVRDCVGMTYFTMELLQ